jgi:hypothetical protein
MGIDRQALSLVQACLFLQSMVIKRDKEFCEESKKGLWGT